MTTKTLTTLENQPTDDLLHALYFQTEPGDHSCQPCPACGEWSRQGLHCPACVDAELMRRKVDVTKTIPGTTARSRAAKYSRNDGRIRR